MSHGYDGIKLKDREEFSNKKAGPIRASFVLLHVLNCSSPFKKGLHEHKVYILIVNKNYRLINVLLKLRGIV